MIEGKRELLFWVDIRSVVLTGLVAQIWLICGWALVGG